MKWLALLGLLVGGVSLWAGQTPDPPVVIVIGGDTDGYLAPCGCTKPMSGGIRRRIAAIRMLTAGKRSIVLENGGLVVGQDRHDQLKSEALAEALLSAGVDAINLGPKDAALGIGQIASLNNLAPDMLLSTVLRPSERVPIRPFVQKHGVMIGGFASRPELVAAPLGETSISLANAATSFLQSAAEGESAAIAMFQGTLDEARALARSHPTLKLIVYRSSGAPLSQPIFEGKTMLVSPGENGKHVLSVELQNGALGKYRVTSLFPTVQNDAAVSRIYKRYLGRVTQEKLLDKLPRIAGKPFAGNRACGTCHSKAMDVWKKSEHAGAIATLQEDGHHRDPDCVSCHVVGLEFDTGYRSEVDTPQLKNVGCESCHGAGKDHADDPEKFKMSKVGQKACMGCHRKDQSPNFDWNAYWKKIAH
jgi:hypothetical protein